MGIEDATVADDPDQHHGDHAAPPNDVVSMIQNPKETILAEVGLPMVAIHQMILRDWEGIVKPNFRYALQISMTPLIPTTIITAIDDSKWKMVKRGKEQNVFTCKWFYKLKPDEN